MKAATRRRIPGEDRHDRPRRRHGAPCPPAEDRELPLSGGRASRRATIRGVAGAPGRRRALLDADATQRQVRRARAGVHARGPGRQLVRRGQRDADAAGAADPDRRPLGRGASLTDLPHGVQRPDPRREAIGLGAFGGDRQVALPDLPKPGRDGNGHSRREARGCPAPHRWALEAQAAKDRPGPERAPGEESDVFLLGEAMATGRRYRGGLVDLRTGLTSREIFVNEEIYAEELERVFTRLAVRRSRKSDPEAG